MGVTLLPVEIPDILFENDDFIALNKPAGWLSIPARDPQPKDRVLTEWLRSKNEGETWVVHRLDRFTSGVMLFAKTKKSHQEASLWFQNRKIKKTYQFLAAPPPKSPAIQIRKPIDDKPSQTLFEVIEKTETVFFGKATPLTGRFHQIREHAQVAGFPILGDQKFGGLTAIVNRDQTIVFPRFCLHAFELQLPFGTFQAPLALDLIELKKKLFS